MKKLKKLITERYNYALGVFLIWVVPIASLFIMAFDGETQTIKVKTWCAIALVIMMAIYFIKGRSALAVVKNRQLTRDNHVHTWVRFIEFVASVIPFVIGILLLETIEKDVNEARMFLIISMCAVAVGGLLLMVDSRKQETIAEQSKKQ